MPSQSDPLRKGRTYPGRTRVISRDDARDFLFRDRMTAATPARHPCSNPYPIHAIGLPSMLDTATKPLAAELQARCRQCEQCLAHRRRLWTARAVHEIDVAERTWFGTLTVNPMERFRLKVLADQRVSSRRREPWSSLNAAEQFQELAWQLNREATLFLKRLRENTKIPLRYLLVTEAHKSGDPHLHILIHEPKDPVRKIQLEKTWRIGFSHWRLVDRDPRAAVYACKYLAKDALTRVRSSQSYGQSQKLRILTERLEGVTRALS